MIIGHYAASFAAKAIEPRVPLWHYFLAAQLIDFGWAIFVYTGLERAQLVEGFTRTYPFDFYYMPYSHSLLAAIVWSIVAFVLHRAFSRGEIGRGSLWIAAVVFSHWLLDLLVHPADLSLTPLDIRVGFGLWNFPITAIVAEAVLLLSAFAFYAHRCHLTIRARNLMMVTMLIIIIVLPAVFLLHLNPSSINVVVLGVFFGYAALTWISNVIEKKLQH